MFIVFEGIDGSGKSTQARILADTFESLGIPYVLTREPSDGIVGQKIRNLTTRLGPREESRLFLEDRLDHVQRVVAPAIRDGKHVICDRYYYSSAAYQGAQGMDPIEIIEENRSRVPVPDIVFLIEVPIETALNRITLSRSGRFSIFEKRKDLKAVARMYKTFKDPVIKRIDGEKPSAEVHLEIVGYLKKAGLKICKG